MLKTTSVIDQVAIFLREEISKGRWTTYMPGRRSLAQQLKVSHGTIQGALDQLQREALLISEGKGKKRRINYKKDIVKSGLRINIMLYDRQVASEFESNQMRRLLQFDGNVVTYADKDFRGLKMSVARVANYVKRKPCDAWVLQAPTREILEWFVSQSIPVFTLFGEMLSLPVSGASPRKIPALKTLIRRLHELGHSRIVMLTREDRRKPYLVPFTQAFLDELEALGVPTSSYHLPDWGDSKEELQSGLDVLFGITPPTALIIGEPKIFIAVRDYLSQRGIVAPRDISLICTDYHPLFSWCIPEISHILWNFDAILDSVSRWAHRTAAGKVDHRQTFVDAVFVEGGTIGAAPNAR